MCNWQQPAVAPSGSAPWMFPGFGEIAREFFRLFAVLSLNLSPIWLCLSPWLGCCVRLAGLVCGLVSQFVSHLALSPHLFPIWLCLFTLAGVLCPSRWACLRSCLPICLPSCFDLALSFTLAGVLCPPRWACLRSCLPMCLPICLPSGFVSQFCLPICSLALSFTLAGVLCPPRWACLQFVRHLPLSFSLAGALCPPRWACLPICLPTCLASLCLSPAVSASLGLSPNLSPNLSPIWLCLSPWLGCCVRLAGLVSLLSLVLSPSFCLCFVS